MALVAVPVLNSLMCADVLLRNSLVVLNLCRPPSTLTTSLFHAELNVLSGDLDARIYTQKSKVLQLALK